VSGNSRGKKAERLTKTKDAKEELVGKILGVGRVSGVNEGERRDGAHVNARLDPFPPSRFRRRPPRTPRRDVPPRLLRRDVYLVDLHRHPVHLKRISSFPLSLLRKTKSAQLLPLLPVTPRRRPSTPRRTSKAQPTVPPPPLGFFLLPVFFFRGESAGKRGSTAGSGSR